MTDLVFHKETNPFNFFHGTFSFCLFWKMNVIKNERERGDTINEKANAMYNAWRKKQHRRCHL